MYKVFVEYKINKETEAAYLRYMRQLREREGRLELLAGTDQPGLYVEIWNDMTYAEYEGLKKRRLEEPDTPEWQAWVQGGLSNLHMWHFTAVS